MLEVIILTSDDFGLAAHHLPFLLKSEKIRIKGVIVSKGVIINKKKYFIFVKIKIKLLICNAK